MLKRQIILVISLWFYFFCWLWRWINRVLGKQIAGSCVILLYHKVASKNRNRFRKQMKILRHFAKPISANNTKPLEEGTHYAAVTFDDGFTSILENAVPELQTLKIPLTFFVPTGYLGRNPGWIHDENHQHYSEVVVDSDQLKALNDDLITIGSHGVNHLRISDLSKDDAKKEISESKHSLESIINKPIELFAFPHGAYTPALVNTALQKGYKRVFTTLPKLAFSEPNEVITGRIDVSPDDWHIQFILKLLGAYRWLPMAFFVKRKILNIYNHIASFFRNGELTKEASHKIIK